MRKTAVYKDPLFLAHATGRDHLESAGRLLGLYRELEQAEVAAQLFFPGFSKAGVTAIKRIHTPELVRAVAETAGRAATFLDADTRTSADSHEAALLAAGAVIDGIRRLTKGEIDNGFCLVRPPGHHAEHNRAMGFCLFNNIAVAAKWALDHCGFERIMIVDWDLHHGNGTQKSFYRSEKVLYCSSHQYPFYPGTGSLPEAGEGRGRGYTVNIPLCGGHGDAEYARLFNALYSPIARAYQPQLILVSCGFDIMAGDPVGSMQVTGAGIAYLTRVLVELAEELCQGRILFTLEGGYDLDNMRTGVLAVLTELHGSPLSPSHPVFLTTMEYTRFRSSKAASASLDQALSWARQRWRI
jgi:acetoin utilization deacetylase AcuC-like enzyme